MMSRIGRTLCFAASLGLAFGLTACEEGPESCFEFSGNLVQVTSDTMAVDHLEATLHPTQPVVLFSTDYWGSKAVDDDGNRDFALIDLPAADETRTAVPTVLFNGARQVILGRLPSDDGSDFDTLGEGNFGVKEPAWHPDGTRFAGAVRNDKGFERLFLLEIPGLGSGASNVIVSNATLIDDVNLVAGGNNEFYYYLAPTFSPDGNWLAYVRFYFKPPDPNNGIPAITENPAIYAWNLNDGTVLKVTPGSSIEGDPSFSPDGSRLVFESNRSGPQREIYSIAFDSSSSTPVESSLRRLTFSNTDPDDKIPVESFEPTWLEDGRILFVSTRRAPCLSLRIRNLWIIDGAGSDAQMVFFSRQDDHFPGVASAVSPGSAVFSSRSNPVVEWEDAKTDIYLVNGF